MPSALRLSILASATTALVFAVAGSGLSTPEALLERQLGAELGRLDTRADGPVEAGPLDPRHLHLSRMPIGGPALPPLAPGDRITLAQRAGGLAQYEVSEVRPLTPGLLGDYGSDQPRLHLVVAVSVDPSQPATIRFIVDADAPSQGPAVPRAALQPL